MCKYCESKEGIRILSYNNANSMNIAYGLRQGVNVDADIKFIGNMLLLSGSGSYTSKSDCYYESWDLECDGEQSIDSKAAYVRINFCPFCGKELDSDLYERTYLQDQIAKSQKKLEKLYVDFSYYSPMIQFSWENPNNKKQWNVEDGDFTLNELIKNFNNVQCQVEYYSKHCCYVRTYHCGYKFFTLKTKIKLNWGNYKNEFSIRYLLNEKVAKELDNIGVLKYDEKAWKKTLAELQPIQDKIKEVKKQLKEYKNELEQYND